VLPHRGGTPREGHVRQRGEDRRQRHRRGQRKSCDPTHGPHPIVPVAAEPRPGTHAGRTFLHAKHAFQTARRTFGFGLNPLRDPYEAVLSRKRETIYGVRLLLIEDDRRLTDLLSERLERSGHDVTAAYDGPSGLELACSSGFDVAVIDVMVPGIDGIEVASELRARGLELPILMLTARDTIGDRVRGLRSGADDYLVKPFAFEELLARIEALGRRLEPRERLGFGPIALDVAGRRVTVDGREISLTATEFDLLACLLHSVGRVMTRAQLKEQVWDFDFDAQTKVVDLYVHYLRKKLGAAGKVIQTVRGVGYAVGR
jgi:DNA-binding response OmpR family regulator